MNKLKKVPLFKTEKEERLFWKKNDSTKYVDWSVAKKVVLPKLKPTTESISLRLPLSLLNKLKNEANKKDIPYQSYIKMKLSA
jgi:predicted DNA binding CopG/RHH family protein